MKLEVAKTLIGAGKGRYGCGLGPCAGRRLSRAFATGLRRAELFPTSRWTLLTRFDGEFAPGSQTYAGSGTLRYSW